MENKKTIKKLRNFFDMNYKSEVFSKKSLSEFLMNSKNSRINSIYYIQEHLLSSLTLNVKKIGLLHDLNVYI